MLLEQIECGSSCPLTKLRLPDRKSSRPRQASKFTSILSTLEQVWYAAAHWITNATGFLFRGRSCSLTPPRLFHAAPSDPHASATVSCFDDITLLTFSAECVLMRSPVNPPSMTSSVTKLARTPEHAKRTGETTPRRRHIGAPTSAANKGLRHTQEGTETVPPHKKRWNRARQNGRYDETTDLKQLL